MGNSASNRVDVLGLEKLFEPKLQDKNIGYIQLSSDELIDLDDNYSGKAKAWINLDLSDSGADLSAGLQMHKWRNFIQDAKYSGYDTLHRVELSFTISCACIHRDGKDIPEISVNREADKLNSSKGSIAGATASAGVGWETVSRNDGVAKVNVSGAAGYAYTVTFTSNVEFTTTYSKFSGKATKGSSYTENYGSQVGRGPSMVTWKCVEKL